MNTNKIFHKKTRRGNIVKVIREHYLRDDIGCGILSCKFCCKLTSTMRKAEALHCLASARLQMPSINSVVSSPHIIVADSNVILHQMDILEDELIGNVVVPQTVVDEVKHRSPPVYKKLKDLFSNSTKGFYYFYNEFHIDTYLRQLKNETINDRNDRAVRKVAQWYSSHLKNANLDVQCILLTDDRGNAAKAAVENIKTYTVSDYVHGLKNRPDLLDKLAASFSDSTHDEKFLIPKGRVLFPEHLPLSELKCGLKNGKYFQGSFQASRDNFLEGTIFADTSDKHREIFVQGWLNINRAVHNDLVVVELLPEKDWSCPMAVLKLHELEKDQGDELEVGDEDLGTTTPNSSLDETSSATKRAVSSKKPAFVPTGRVVGILRRNWRPYCGLLDLSPIEGATRHLFVAAERRIPRVRIETRQSQLLAGQRIVVCIDSWPRDSRYPKGHFVRALGTLGDKTTETDVILLEHDIPHSNFSEAVLGCLPDLPWIITEQDYKERRDLRHLNICSIDPPGCTDIDDALHCRRLDDGTLEIGVHIADVSHFVKPGTAMDAEAAERGTTVYLVGKRIDMLPDLLSGNLCSLKSRVERFAFSVICRVTDQGDILSTEFAKSIIESKFSFTYAEAQMRIDDPGLNDELTISLRNLLQLSKKLRSKRKANGSLSLASLEIRFNIDSETHDPINVEAKQALETNSLVEEFMLLANIAVAQRIYDEFPDCALLRRHPVPPTSNYDPLVKAAASRGFEILVDSGPALSQTLERAQMSENPYFNTMLRILTTRCMTQAVYFSSGTIDKKLFYHFGLASPIYTHFTSPIRRYADLMVHRFLASAIQAQETYPELLDAKKQENLCRNLNYRHKQAQLAGRASVLSNTHLFFKDKREDLEAYILGVRKNALQVLVPKYGLESAVVLRKGQHPFEYDEQNGCLTYKDVCLRMFDKVTVQLSVDDRDPQHYKLKLQLVEPKIENFSVEPLFDVGLDEGSLSQTSKNRLDDGDNNSINDSNNKKQSSQIVADNQPKDDLSSLPKPKKFKK